MHTYKSAFIHTVKEVPKDAEVISHQLMVRTGMIKKLASGIYSILPLGQRVFSKMMAIIRDEMNRIDGVECHMPCTIPAELWQSSGRWDKYGKELLRFEDRQGRSFCFGPTHEEVITDIVSTYVSSYKQLPVMLYQIQTKFRDEIRPRFGLMRGREFFMKDAYSFHDTQESLQETYEAARGAYAQIFNRCGLTFIEAKADSGSIGGDVSAEFLVVAESGEDEVLVNRAVNFAANVEACDSVNIDYESTTNLAALESVLTPGQKTIKAVATFLNVSEDATIKSLLVQADDRFILVCLPGDRELNESKLKSLIGDFRFASDNDVMSVMASPAGYIGPVNHNSNISIYLDYSLKKPLNYCCGANKTDEHFINVNIARDIKQFEWADLKNAKAGDACPTDPTKQLDSMRGIEVGHVFKLGKKYSDAMNAHYNDSNGKRQSFEMGCYGIGVGRTIAAAIEQSHDEKGIVWPDALAPFHVVIVHLCPKDDEMNQLVKQLVDVIESSGRDVIVDDRNDSPGVKFNDADLIGYPYQIVIGRKVMQSKQIELKKRRDGELILIDLDQIESIGELL